MDTSYSLLLECCHLNKPSRFNRNHYTYLKQKMKDFVEAIDIDMWDIIENVYELPKILVDGVA